MKDSVKKSEKKVVEKKKKKLSNYEKEKVIKEISKSINRNMTRRYLMDLALGRI